MIRKFTLPMFFLAVIFIAGSELTIAQQIKGTPGSAGVIIKSIPEIMSEEARMPVKPPKFKKERENRRRKKKNPLSPLSATFGGEGNVAARSTSVTQSIYSNFLATYVSEGAGYYPPDCNGDISTSNQVMVTVNGRLKVYNVPTVTGTPATTSQTNSSTTLASPVINVNINAFFAGSGATDFSDPHVRFDRLSGRWFICIIDVTNTSSNFIAIAVSNNAPNTPLTSTSTFKIFYLNSATGSSTPTDDFFDYPTLGVDANALYIGGNTFNAAGNAYKGSPIYVVNKSSALSATAPNVSFTAFQYGSGASNTGSTGSIGIWTPQGVHNDDPAATEGYLIGTDNAAFGKLIIKRVSNPGGTPTLSSDIAVTIPINAFPQTQSAIGSTGTRKLDALDDRLFAAMIMKNKVTGISTLWTSHATLVNSAGVSSSGDRNGSRWYEIGNLTGTPSLLQSGTLFDNATTNPRGFWIPSIAMSGQGHAILGCTVSAANRYTQVAIAGRYFTDGAGILQAYDTATKATASYSDPFTGTQRWGDYSQTVVDPNDNMTMWTFQEYANNTNVWGLRAVQLKAPPPATPSFSSALTCGAAVNMTINGTSVNNSGFFDPGTGYNNRLQVSIRGTGTALSSTLAVSNIAFVNPTQINCTINTTGAISGATYRLFVTNPDGQVDSSYTFSSPCSTCLNNPAAPTGTSNSRCGSGVVTISATAGSGETIDWYPTATGGTLLTSGNNSFTTPSISTTTTYYAEARDTLTGCLSTSRTAVIANVNALPSAPAGTGASRCGTGSVTLSATPASGESIYWYTTASGVTASQSSSNFYTTPAISITSTFFAEARNNLTDCASSTRSAVIATINAITSSTTTAGTCSNQLPYVWNGSNYSSSGTYTYTRTNSAGCDSLAILSLTVKQSSASTASTSVCSNQLPYAWNGNNYNVSGTYTYTAVNAAGCDSIVTLQLTVKQTTSSSSTISVCSSYVWNGTTYTTSGLKTYTSTNAAGCDSVASLSLTIKQASSSSSSITACNSYQWNGTTYTTSGTKTWTSTNASGCDSVATLYLSITSGNFANISDTACDTYQWHGVNYLSSGTYLHNYTNCEGLPATDTLYLTIKKSSSITEKRTACANFTWHGVPYTASGTYYYYYINQNGCPSRDVLILKIKQ